ncbi:3,4-dioxygenase subunit beta [Arthrobacter sp. YC-RL1]|uniref:intradiol ring-cleavage dioxygenase n=1 Tax=Arthrobacter sp. YC-RL1 TaxID=1652545 RepID=UPI00063D8BE5|nr:intradiol ring-cleavage dioxygenase [Arthrobacter sp. YC-RL1]ALQ29713.1 3,4-dioxygenase subunit beta [Arthrobacter sp. YC-RL1]KLI88929.1 3,4-dioxygenase subunit beta [Arthrobacter sp. YC-RL1]
MNPPPRWFGHRQLPRPEEDLEDQGLSFDVGTLIERRKVLAGMGVGTLAFALAACSPTGTQGSPSPSTAAEIPDETAGPYPGDGSNGPDVLEQSGIVRSDIRSSFGTSTTTAEGIPMTLELKIVDMANNNQPFEGVAVYVWHCDRSGEYSMYSSGLENENYLRGVQVADADGQVRYTSIFPACYAGRWPHIHFEVYPDTGSITDHTTAIATSQVALPQETCTAVYATTGYEQSVKNLQGVSLDSDNVFGDDSGATQLATITGDTSAGYTVRLTVNVDTNTEATGGGAPGGGGALGGGEAPGGMPTGRPPALPDGQQPGTAPTASAPAGS